MSPVHENNVSVLKHLSLHKQVFLLTAAKIAYIGTPDDVTLVKNFGAWPCTAREYRRRDEL